MEEIEAHLRSHRLDDLRAVLDPVARYEQGLHPYFLAPDDELLIRDLLALDDEPAALAQRTEALDVERLRDLVRRTLIRWHEPVAFSAELNPYVHRYQDHVLWLLERVSLGVTGVRVDASISGQLPAGIPYPDSYPDRVNDFGDVLYEGPNHWWRDYTLHLGDDLGTEYRLASGAGTGCRVRDYPVRTRVNGQWEAHASERYIFLYKTGVPADARELTLSGRINLTIEEPTTGPMPWPTKDLSLGDFSYTIDLTHWWPPTADEEYLEYLRGLDD